MKKKPHEHFSFTVPTEVTDICKPLANIFGINLFIYQRSLIDIQNMSVNSNAFLCNNAEALEFILSIPQKKRESAKYDYSSIDKKYVLIETTQPQFASILRNKFDFNNILCRDEQIDNNEWEHFIIGTPSNNTTIINSYLNNMELLEKFVAYFRQKATRLIDKACGDRFTSTRPIEKCNFNILCKLPNGCELEKFSMLPDPKHYYISNILAKKIAVPKAEMHCLLLLSQGRSAKEIAKASGISPRTVESHISNAKIRLGCNTKSNLLNILENWKKHNIWAL